MSRSSPTRSRSTVAIGRDAESRVAAHYLARGYALVARNVRLGRLELDLVLRRDALVVVCEVKHRASSHFGHPASSVDRLKRDRVRRATARWLEQSGESAVVRFDVATIVGDPRAGRLTVFESAF